MRVADAALDAPTAAGHSIHFFADGSTSGGAILITAGSQTWRVCASLAGDVTLDDALGLFFHRRD